MRKIVYDFNGYELVSPLPPNLAYDYNINTNKAITILYYIMVVCYIILC